MRLACAFDHAGVPLRDVTFAALREAGHEAVDLGTDDEGSADDYPDRALDVGRAIRDGRAERGILVCGSGAGVAVAACKLEGIRCAMAHDTYTARQCVEHDDVNILALGARVVGPGVAGDLVRAFADAEFSGEERHVRRVAKVRMLEREGFGAKG